MATKQNLALNVGILGHVDSGKTSLAKVLSTVSSTAAFDKNPQSKQRGITIDLGFSSVQLPLPPHLQSSGFQQLHLTLVDCPGHASLIRTIIMGAEIVDFVLLVVDVVKGIQTQTAECIVIAEITCDKMIIVLNKVDLISVENRKATIEKVSKRILKALEKTKFANSPIVAVAAKPGGGDIHEDKWTEPIGIDDLLKSLSQLSFLPERNRSNPFLMAVDHCFLIRGQGTIVTGTILQGCVKLNETIEIPSINVTKKVKSIQMFKKPIEEAIQGDRIGICVTQFDQKLLERGVICAPGYLNKLYAVIVSTKKVPYFKGSCKTKSKFHISIMHDTVMARVTFFQGVQTKWNEFNFDQEYKHLNELDEVTDSNDRYTHALLEFEQPVLATNGVLFIASKLDTDIHANVCRLAFHGRVIDTFKEKNYHETSLQKLKVFKLKTKEGVVERIANEYEVIGKALFKKQANIECFKGLKVTLSTGDEGIIDGSFGQSGKVKIRIPKGLKDYKYLIDAKKEKSSEKTPIAIYLTFKRYSYDKTKKIVQT
ncbi:selenocysteine-specific elongation factor-like protein [Dinothrombium tinctorium]|uniref:Selenocysteine-specific elongation factor n=1 Tax=Dinothrombium tinctorium TaxID=1965070 RepID=A0A3S4QR10_9ACAR|nr:selenocysteine-specific elongation factor-like protein [Dinothrombium tinctorium]